MKPPYLLTPLLLAAALLFGCADAKLPSPRPKVPEPKAEKTVGQPVPVTLAVSPLAGRAQSEKPA